MSLKILIATYFHKNKETAGKKLFDGITRRNPQLFLRNPENVYFLFDILEKIVDKNKLSCDTISNVEESGFTRAEIDVKGDCPLNINFTSHESISKSSYIHLQLPRMLSVPLVFGLLIDISFKVANMHH